MILLTSIGLSTSGLIEILKSLNLQKKWQNACILVSADKDGQENKYALLAKAQLHEIGISDIDFIDFFEQDIELINNYDLVYIAGGNTFRLLQSIIRHNNGLKVLRDILKDKDVIGVSAGSILLTPTIRIANEVEPDEYLEVSNFEALGLVSFEIYPHYEQRIGNEIAKYESKYNTIVVKITNDEYVLIE